MSQRHYVWLLYQGGSEELSEPVHLIRSQLEDSLIYASSPGWLRPLLIWFHCWLRQRSLQQQKLLTGPCSSFDAAEQQSKELNRLLGEDYHCRPVHLFGQQNLESALKDTPRHAPVVLLPLIPYSCASLFSLLRQSRTALQAQNRPVIEIPSWHRHHGYIEAVAETIRTEIIDLKGRKDYCLLFVLGRQPESWTHPPEELFSEAQSSALQIVKTLEKNIPWSVAQLSGKTKIQTILSQWITESRKVLIVIPLTWSCASSDMEQQLSAVHPLLEQEGFEQIIQSQTLSLRSTFLRTLAEVVFQATEEK